ncbi:unnamed protein product [Peronospora belbahrii]|uniref:Aminotransferase class I/classII large domain-containing protein n=1 Tax=Peronospora belbahrii TaxID=622444 RepID=A0AAU9KMS3_9STRA|nr:unnamed protein product [Peronospora belbahrii]
MKITSNSLVQVQRCHHPEADIEAKLMCPPDQCRIRVGGARVRGGRRAPGDFKKHYFSTLEENAKFTIQTLMRIPGLDVVVPQGKIRTDILATIKDDLDLTQKLLDEESVFVLPGQCFGIANYFRIVFSAPHEVLADAFIRLAEFCYRHQ